MYILGDKGIRAMIYLQTGGSHEKNHFFFYILVFPALIHFSIYSYAFESTNALSTIRGFDAIFYGHYVRSCILFLICNFIEFVMLISLLYDSYYSFFVKRK